MRSVNNNWLAFSLCPHLTVDVPDSSAHAQNPPMNAGYGVAPHLPCVSIGYSAASDCYEISGENGSFSSQMLDTQLRPEGSLCAMDALTRAHGGDWQFKTLDSLAIRGAHQSVTAAEPQYLLSTELASFNGAERMGAGAMLLRAKSEDGPKLEDFLGGASVDRDSQSAVPENIYCNGQGFEREESLNMAFPMSRGREVPPFHSFEYPTDSRALSFQEQKFFPSYQTDLPPHNLLHLPLNQSSQDNVFSDCSLQLPPASTALGSGNNIFAVSALKPWIRHSPAAPLDKEPVSSSCLPKGNLNALGDLQSLSLSMSPGLQSNALLVQQPVHNPIPVEPRKRASSKAGSREPTPRKSIDTFGQRTSQYRGVTRHRWTGRYEAHLWDNSCRKEGQTRKGRQVYLGGYDTEERAARAYDLAALKYWGPATHINYPLSTYETELEEMKNMARQEYVASFRCLLSKVTKT